MADDSSTIRSLSAAEPAISRWSSAFWTSCLVSTIGSVLALLLQIYHFTVEDYLGGIIFHPAQFLLLLVPISAIASVFHLAHYWRVHRILAVVPPLFALSVLSLGGSSTLEHSLDDLEFAQERGELERVVANFEAGKGNWRESSYRGASFFHLPAPRARADAAGLILSYQAKGGLYILFIRRSGGPMHSDNDRRFERDYWNDYDGWLYSVRGDEPQPARQSPKFNEVRRLDDRWYSVSAYSGF